MSNSILVDRGQEKNPLLKYIYNVPWKFEDIPCDYQVGKTTGVLFLSLRFHRLHPNYIYERIKEIENKFVLRIALILVDIKDPDNNVKELTRVSFLLNVTVVLAWNYEEAAKYVEILKAYEHKPLEAIKKNIGSTDLERLKTFFTAAQSVNKTDSMEVLREFKSLSNFANAANEDSLRSIPGMGPSKTFQLIQLLDSPLSENDNK